MAQIKSGVYFSALQATSATLEATLAQLPPSEGVEDGIRPDGVVPADIVRAMARLRLLEGIPFSYLVPDAELTPPETIRFFYLDRNATDAIVQGALSVGTVNSADRAQLADLYATVRGEVDAAERLVRMKDSDAPAVDAAGRPIGPGGDISGFVLRSRLVSGWPGMHVRAYSVDNGKDDVPIPDVDTSPNRVRLLRMERLAPAVLFVLFDGVPKVVHLEEPRAGVQFGVRLDAVTDPTKQSAVVTLRDVTNPNAGPIMSGTKPLTVPVRFRSGSPGVIDMRQLNDDMLNVTATNMGTTVNSAEFAMQMLRFPLRQVFGAPRDAPDTDAFVPSFSVTVLVGKFSLATRVLGKG
jgi:hypothetical protein